MSAAGGGVPRVSLGDRSVFDRLFGAADASEAARVSRYRRSQDAQDYLHARALARDLVAGLVSDPAEQIRLTSHDDAPPTVQGHERLAVSWSRSGPLAAAAVMEDGRVGVDIERILPRATGPMLDMIANEAARDCVMQAGDEAGQLTRFYRLWTAKEAILKWQGDGLRRGPKSINISEDFLTGQVDEISHDNNGLIVTLKAVHADGAAICCLAFSGQRPI